MKTKTIKVQAAQGDVLFRKRAQPIPADATKQKRGEIIVAHSETGHHHVAQGPALQFFTSKDPLISFLRVPKHADIVHKRDFDTHEGFRLDAGDWDVVRQREWTPEGLRRVED